MNQKNSCPGHAIQASGYQSAVQEYTWPSAIMQALSSSMAPPLRVGAGLGAAGSCGPVRCEALRRPQVFRLSRRSNAGGALCAAKRVRCVGPQCCWSRYKGGCRHASVGESWIVGRAAYGLASRWRIGAGQDPTTHLPVSGTGYTAWFFRSHQQAIDLQEITADWIRKASRQPHRGELQRGQKLQHLSDQRLFLVEFS